MSTDYQCVRCGTSHKWEELTQTSQGNLFCSKCWKALKTETKRPCPVDDSEMEKQLVSDMVYIDTCAKCGGTWFDRGELDLIRKKWREEDWRDGFMVGWLF